MVDGETETPGLVEPAYLSMKFSNGDLGGNFSWNINSKSESLSANAVGMSDIRFRGMTCSSLSYASGMACERKKMGVAGDTGFGQKEVEGDKGKRVGKDYGGEPMFGQVEGDPVSNKDVGWQLRGSTSRGSCEIHSNHGLGRGNGLGVLEVGPVELIRCSGPEL